MRKPDRMKLPGVAALLLSSDLRLLVRHAPSCLPARSGRLLQPGDAEAELLEAAGIRRAIASMRHRPTRPSRSDRPALAVRVIASRGLRSRRTSSRDDRFDAGADVRLGTERESGTERC